MSASEAQSAAPPNTARRRTATIIMQAIRSRKSGGRCWLVDLLDALRDQNLADGPVVVGRLVAEGRLAIIPTFTQGLGLEPRPNRRRAAR